METKTPGDTIRFPRHLLKKEGVVVLSLEEYERLREDLDMLSSTTLIDDVAQARAEARGGKVRALSELL